jgi:hypothetical protein
MNMKTTVLHLACGGRQEILEGVMSDLVMEYSVTDPKLFFSDMVNPDPDLDSACF